MTIYAYHKNLHLLNFFPIFKNNNPFLDMYFDRLDNSLKKGLNDFGQDWIGNEGGSLQIKTHSSKSDLDNFSKLIARLTVDNVFEKDRNIINNTIQYVLRKYNKIFSVNDPHYELLFICNPEYPPHENIKLSYLYVRFERIFKKKNIFGKNIYSTHVYYDYRDRSEYKSLHSLKISL